MLHLVSSSAPSWDQIAQLLLFCFFFQSDDYPRWRVWSGVFPAEDKLTKYTIHAFLIFLEKNAKSEGSDYQEIILWYLVSWLFSRTLLAKDDPNEIFKTSICLKLIEDRFHVWCMCSTRNSWHNCKVCLFSLATCFFSYCLWWFPTFHDGQLLSLYMFSIGMLMIFSLWQGVALI